VFGFAVLVEESVPIGEHAFVKNPGNCDAARFATKEDDVARVLEAEEARTDVIAWAS